MGFSADMDSGNVSLRDQSLSHGPRVSSPGRKQLVGLVPATRTVGQMPLKDGGAALRDGQDEGIAHACSRVGYVEEQTRTPISLPDLF